MTYDYHTNYSHDYKTGLISIPLERSLGLKLKKSESLQEFLSASNCLDIYTDGCKIPTEKFAGAAICSMLCP